MKYHDKGDQVEKVYYSTKEVAHILGCSTTWVWFLSKKIRFKRSGKKWAKFTPQNLEAMKLLVTH